MANEDPVDPHQADNARRMEQFLTYLQSYTYLWAIFHALDRDRVNWDHFLYDLFPRELSVGFDWLAIWRVELEAGVYGREQSIDELLHPHQSSTGAVARQEWTGPGRPEISVITRAALARAARRIEQEDFPELAAGLFQTLGIPAPAPIADNVLDPEDVNPPGLVENNHTTPDPIGPTGPTPGLPSNPIASLALEPVPGFGNLTLEEVLEYLDGPNHATDPAVPNADVSASSVEDHLIPVVNAAVAPVVHTALAPVVDNVPNPVKNGLRDPSGSPSATPSATPSPNTLDSVGLLGAAGNSSIPPFDEHTPCHWDLGDAGLFESSGATAGSRSSFGPIGENPSSSLGSETINHIVSPSNSRRSTTAPGSTGSSNYIPTWITNPIKPADAHVSVLHQLFDPAGSTSQAANEEAPPGSLDLLGQAAAHSADSSDDLADDPSDVSADSLSDDLSDEQGVAVVSSVTTTPAEQPAAATHPEVDTSADWEVAESIWREQALVANEIASYPGFAQGVSRVVVETNRLWEAAHKHARDYAAFYARHLIDNPYAPYHSPETIPVRALQQQRLQRQLENENENENEREVERQQGVGVYASAPLTLTLIGAAAPTAPASAPGGAAVNTAPHSAVGSTELHNLSTEEAISRFGYQFTNNFDDDLYDVSSEDRYQFDKSDGSDGWSSNTDDRRAELFGTGTTAHAHAHAHNGVGVTNDNPLPQESFYNASPVTLGSDIDPQFAPPQLPLSVPPILVDYLAAFAYTSLIPENELESLSDLEPLSDDEVIATPAIATPISPTPAIATPTSPTPASTASSSATSSSPTLSSTMDPQDANQAQDQFEIEADDTTHHGMAGPGPGPEPGPNAPHQSSLTPLQQSRQARGRNPNPSDDQGEYAGTDPHNGPTDFEQREEQHAAAIVLDNYELLTLHAMANDETIPQTRLRFEEILCGIPHEAEEEEDIGAPSSSSSSSSSAAVPSKPSRR